ncbi:MAG: hypothetical protein O3C34_19865 [Proteobacteria bacterium]|nr:hypothetical protein [Pseudomonadota bacterium]
MKIPDPTCRYRRNGALAVAAAILVFSSAPGIAVAADSPAPAGLFKPAVVTDALIPDLAGPHDQFPGTREQSAAETGKAGSNAAGSPASSRVSPNHDYTINLRVVPWLAQPGGNATLGSLGTDVELHDDLGIDSYKITPAGSANLRFGRHDFWFDALAVDISASDTVDRTITFGSLTIPVSRGVRSELDLQLYDLRYGYSFFDLQADGFRLGPTLGIAYLDFDVKITDQVTGTSNRLSESFPIPRLGLQGSIPFGQFDLGAKFAGLYIGYGDFEGYTIEGDISLAWRPLRNFGLVAGYRAIRTDIEYKNDNFNLTFQGPYLGAELRF